MDLVSYTSCPVVQFQEKQDNATRLKLDRELSQTNFEHVLVFVTADRERQLWMWVRREPDRPLRALTHEYLRGQPGDSLLQKLERLFVSLEDEEAGLSVPEVAARASAAFNVERVVKRFYKDFNDERKKFLKFVTGITDQGDHEWYASVMLNRLMFIYFIQRKGFLDGDYDYLRNRLRRMQANHGRDKFYSFYRYFLLRLFHEGLGSKERSKDLDALVGQIPYLNGGIFDVHELERPERYGKTIQIPDQAFQRIFDFFDQWHWHLDDRPVRADNEINPDVLGYIYEKYINQKQMGAYYTKEDITEYISKNTILPFLFDAARAKCKVAFENPNGPTLWDLLRNDPDRYIYPAVRHGVDIPLPEEIERGVNPPTLHQPVGDGPVLTLELRKGWNKSAPADYALPTETWREVVARRQRCEDIRRKLAAGEIRDINDLITLNLDIRQFAQDVIAGCEKPELLRAFWHAIEKVTVLDPTCGSGAFLFAALNILEPLYDACLDRMEAFLTDEAAKTKPAKLKRTPHGLPLLPNGRLKDFSKVLELVAGHPSKRYFVYKRIILGNLYGVDIMEEAVEICKLRLFLKLAAQVDPDATHANLGIEPLPDIDFNIKAGNTLVGYVSLEQIRQGAQEDIERLEQFERDFPRIQTAAADLQTSFDRFREMQVKEDGAVPSGLKEELRKRLNALNQELDRYLAREYGINPEKSTDFNKWKTSHQPFHWLVEFFGIMQQGGFDVIIGNPPYVEVRTITSYSITGFLTIATGDLYALVTERAYRLSSSMSSIGVIIPLSAFSVSKFAPLQKVCMSESSEIWVSHWSGDAHPSKLFEGVDKRLSILVARTGSQSPLAFRASRYHKWYSVERQVLFDSRPFYYSDPESQQETWFEGAMTKIHSDVESGISQRLLSQKNRIFSIVQSGSHNLYYTRKISFFLQFLDFIPRVLDADGNQTNPSELKTLEFSKLKDSTLALACLSSTLFYWFNTINSDCRNLNKREVTHFPIPAIDATTIEDLARLVNRLMDDYSNNSSFRTVNYKRVGNVTVQYFNFRPSKPIIDEIETVLARNYGFTEEQLDFIINYDIKYRMGKDGGS